LITQFIIRYSESKSVVQNINRIDPHAAFTAPDEDENTYLNPSLRGASYATWQSHLAILLKTIKGTPP
jgi:hypothetical protein